jgi:hypothetical protein
VTRERGQPPISCAQCGGPLIHRDRALLFLVGMVMCAAPLIAYFVPLLWVPALLAMLAGAYLILWSTLGKGLWCRQCKSFRM